MNLSAELLALADQFNGSIPLEADLKILFQPDPVLISFYALNIVLSLVANALLITVAIKCNYTKNVTNIFLVNLSSADLMVTFICMPIQLSKSFTVVWYYGVTVCKLFNYMQGVAVSASIFTLTTMSVDRWLSISPKPRVRPPGRKLALLILGFIWMLAMLIFAPLLQVAVVQKEVIPVIVELEGNMTKLEIRELHFCTEAWQEKGSREQFGTLSFCLVYAIPGTITILSYAFMGRTLCSVKPPFDIDEGNVSMQQGLRLIKERKRVAWILLLLAVLFALCWLPYNIIQLLLDINAVGPSSVSVFLPYALFLGHANSAINPIVYCLMTRSFQRSARKLLCRKGVCKQVKFTWRCNQKPDESSSNNDAHHEAHNRCYLQMHALRTNRRAHAIGTHTCARGVEMRAQSSQLSQTTRTLRRAAPTHMLSADMLQRHVHCPRRRLPPPPQSDALHFMQA